MLRKLIRWVLLISSICVIVFAVLLTTLRYTTPLINHYRLSIELWAGKVLNRPVHIGRVIASWHGLGPVIKLENVALLDETGQHTVLSIQELDISISLYSSWRQHRINPSYLSITGAQLFVKQTADGHWKVLGLSSTASATEEQAAYDSKGIWQWLGAQNQISLKNITIAFEDNKGIEVPLTHLTIVLRNGDNSHHLVGEGRIDQKQLAHFYFILDVKGHLSTWKQNTIHGYLWVDHLNLQHWLDKFPIKNYAVQQGLVSGQFWLNRQTGVWQSLISTFTLQNLLSKNLTSNTQMGVNSLYGELFWYPSTAKLDNILLLKSNDAIISDSSLFSQPLNLGQMQAIMQSQACGNTYCIAINQLDLQGPAINGQFSAQFSLPTEQTPSQIHIIGHYILKDVRQIKNYLPDKIMGKGLVEWLQMAPLAGQGINGYLSIQGLSTQFPYSQGGGEFINQIDFTHLNLQYAHEWPAGENIFGRLTFKNDSLTAHINAGTLSNASIKQVDLVIPKLGHGQPMIMTIDGQAESNMDNLLNYIQHSPLKIDNALLQNDIQVQGATPLQIHLVFPLDNAPHADLQVQGQVNIQQGQITYTPKNISLTQLQGLVNFDLTSITAPKLTGMLMGYPVQINVQTKPDSQKTPIIHVSAQGGINVAPWIKANWPRGNNLIQGVTNYNLEWNIPLQKRTNIEPSLAVFSDLKGISLNFPDPLNKPANETAPLAVNLDFTKDQFTGIRFNYKDVLSAALNFASKNQQTNLTSGELHFGSGQAAYQKEKGLLIDGSIGQLNVSAWQTLFKQLTSTKPFASTQANTKPQPAPIITASNLISLIDLHVDNLFVFKHTINDIEINASHNNDWWTIAVDSPAALGTVKINDDYPASPLILDFKHLMLPAQDPNDKTPSDLSPVGWPPLYFDCQRCQYGTTQLGTISLNLMPSANGLEIKKLLIQAPNASVNATGLWTQQNAVQQTQVKGTVKSTNFGELLKDLKLTNNIEGKKGEATFDLNWPSPPTDPTLIQVNGNVYLQLGEGRIVDVGSHQSDIDIGKLLNIFSVESLLHHLQFGFTDLAQNGYNFNVMKGTYVLQQGVLTSKDTYFDGSIAKLTLKGDMDLKQQQYNVILGVTPYLTSSIPLIVAVAGTAVAGPLGIIAGAATWAVGKVMSPEIERMTTYQYKVTGPFKNPKITEIQTPLPRNQVPYQ